VVCADTYSLGGIKSEGSGAEVEKEVIFMGSLPLLAVPCTMQPYSSSIQDSVPEEFPHP